MQSFRMDSQSKACSQSMFNSTKPRNIKIIKCFLSGFSLERITQNRKIVWLRILIFVSFLQQENRSLFGMIIKRCCCIKTTKKRSWKTRLETGKYTKTYVLDFSPTNNFYFFFASHHPCFETGKRKKENSTLGFKIAHFLFRYLLKS